MTGSFHPRGSPGSRAVRSLAYRSGWAYRRLARALPMGRQRGKPEMPLIYLTFGCRADAAMLRESLASLARAWPTLPRLRVVSDGSLRRETAEELLSWWPAPWQFRSWEELLPEVRDPNLAAFARREPMGRKLAAIVGAALEGPTLYSDVDVLWFRFPESVRRWMASAGPLLAMSPDWQPAYDAALVPSLLPHLGREPFYCAGLLYAAGDFLSTRRASDLLAFAAEHGIARTEQTILAATDHDLGGLSWPAGEVALFEDDRFSLAPSFLDHGWAARHYVGAVRHIFWRDALALRLGIRSKWPAPT
jgi:hypothetical protein